MRKRPVRITVWLTETELEEIRNACANAELSATDYVRGTVMNRIKRTQARRMKPAFVDGGLFRALEPCHLPSA